MNRRLWGNCFLLISLVLFVGHVFNPGWIFTEWTFYAQFFRSMLQDFDFNIINQVETYQAWLVTKNYFHPSIHPESQTGLMFPLYIFEYITSLIVQSKGIYQLQFVMTGFLMNIFSVFTGFYFNKKSADLLKINLSKFKMVIFFIGSPLFFFSMLQATIVEIAAFPLLSYLVYLCISCKM